MTSTVGTRKIRKFSESYQKLMLEYFCECFEQEI